MFRKLSLSTKLSLKEHLLVATITVADGFSLTKICLSIGTTAEVELLMLLFEAPGFYN